MLPVLLALSLLLGACSQSKQNPDKLNAEALRFCGIPWGSSPEEAKEILNLPADADVMEGSEQENYYVIIISSQPWLGMETQKIHLEFWDHTESGGPVGLSRVTVRFPEETEKEAVMEALEKTYGAYVDGYEKVGRNLDTLEREVTQEYQRTENRAYWLTKQTVADRLNENQTQQVMDYFAGLELPISRELGMEMLETLPLVFMMYKDAYDANEIHLEEDGNEIPFSGIGVLFNAYNQVVIQQSLGVEP